MSSLVDQKNLDLCLAQAANPLDEDVNEEVISQLIHLMKDDKEKIGCVLRFFGHKIQSPQELEAMKALNVLQSLVKRSDKKFIEEVGKFRFLNEMIKVISPKYLAQRSPERVKRKIIELLYLWSIEHKHEPKIFEAYQMLKRQGIITSDPTHLLPNTTPSPPPPPRPKDEIWDNAENALMLKRLIQSGQPADRVAANKLIKILAQQADKKTVIKAKCQAELELARNNARLFAEVLANLTSSDCKNFTEKDLLDELYDSCKKLRPKLFKLAGEMPESEPLFEETLKVNDELTKVINEYDVAMQLVPQPNGNNHTVNSQINDNSCNLLLETSSASPNLLDISTPTHETASSCIVNGGASIMVPDSTDISFSGDDSLLSNHETNKDNLENSIAASAPVPNSSQNISELFEMFPKNETRDLVDAHVNYLKEILVPCMPKPPNAPISPQTSSFSASIPNNEINKSPKKSSCLDELENLMRLTLNAGPKLDGLSDSNIPLNSMRRTVNHPTLNKPNVPFMDALSESVELNPDSSEHLVPSSSIVSDVSPQSIADIFIPLESVEPGNRSPIVLVNENEIKSILNFGANQPRYGVSVAVLTTTNLSKKSICKIFFNITSSKGIRFKYQAPSATVLSPSNPFLPPPAITQVIIFAKTSPDRLEKCYFRLEYSIGSENFVKTGEVNI